MIEVINVHPITSESVTGTPLAGWPTRLTLVLGGEALRDLGKCRGSLAFRAEGGRRADREAEGSKSFVCSDFL